jgi:DNA-binding response OmpR family regulator
LKNYLQGLSHNSAMSTQTAKAEVLIIEDEANIADLVRMYLEREGYRVAHAETGERGLELASARPPTMVILDIGLPGIDGIEVCRRLRAAGRVAILMLTARDSEVDRILGLEMGADDYLTKPFSPRELVARVKAILRRLDPEPDEGTPVVAGGVTVWPDRREVAASGEPVFLTTKELDLLLYLMTNKGIVLSRPQILGGVWGYEFYGGERTVDAHIRTIRRKLGDALPLTTIRGVGYKVERDR